jgi:adenosylcobinamide-phosphate synthase
MWGYQNRRYHQFGWFAARLDDVLNWLPARLSAISYSLVGEFSSAIKCWFSQAKLTKSPNAGVVMAAGAGALGVKLGNRAVYDGMSVERPILGAGDEVTSAHIERAVRLVEHALWLWILVLFFIAGGYYFV